MEYKDRLKAISDHLKSIGDAKSRAEKLQEYIDHGMISFMEINQLELGDVINAGEFFRRQTTFSRDSDYNEVIATEDYTLEGNSIKQLSISTNEWGDVVGYKERGNNGTSKSVENHNDGSIKTVEMGPMMHNTFGKAGKYKKEFETREDGSSQGKNSYEYYFSDKTLQIDELMESKDGEKSFQRMVNGIPSYTVRMKDDEITLVQYNREGEELASYRYDAKTGLPLDKFPDSETARTYPGIDKLEVNDKEWFFEDVISNPNLQKRLLEPEEYQVISQMEQVDFKPSRRLDKLKERIGIDTKSDKGQVLEQDKSKMER